MVEIRDTGALAERLTYLSAQPEERFRMGAAARRRAEDFPWRRYEDSVARLVRSAT
jgi:glycosyltransferase involved in cell wall biosynthesis